MEPLGVRVISVMLGEVESQIYRNAEPPPLPENSYYHSVKQFVADQGAGKFQTRSESAELTARNLVGDVVGGKSGQVWRGGIAGTARLASWLLPTRLFVSDDVIYSR